MTRYLGGYSAYIYTCQETYRIKQWTIISLNKSNGVVEESAHEMTKSQAFKISGILNAYHNSDGRVSLPANKVLGVPKLVVEAMAAAEEMDKTHQPSRRMELSINEIDSMLGE